MDKANQDAFVVKRGVGSDPDTLFFGVFDGHGTAGTECAKFACEKVEPCNPANLHPLLKRHCGSSCRHALLIGRCSAQQHCMPLVPAGSTAWPQAHHICTCPLQVHTNMLGDMDFYSDPGSALANAVIKTNDQLHKAVRACLRPITEKCPQLDRGFRSGPFWTERPRSS